MKVFEDIAACRSAVRTAQAEGMRVGLVPTMGALHEGHLSLIRAARAHCDRVAVTIFVNPTQFAPTDDLDAYPRPLDADLAACLAEGVDLVFTPTVQAMYPDGAQTTVSVGEIATGLCGRSRPGHFAGVATVVAKLFNILPANAAFFGEKDYQQLCVIRQMVRDLDIPIEIVGCPTIREADGLAMSSRNVYLAPAQRKQAVSISRSLLDAVEHAQAGERSAKTLANSIRAQIEAAGPCEIDYVDVVDAQTLVPLAEIDRPARICVAVKIGAGRLIDNVGVDAAAHSR